MHFTYDETAPEFKDIFPSDTLDPPSLLQMLGSGFVSVKYTTEELFTCSDHLKLTTTAINKELCFLLLLQGFLCSEKESSVL